MKKSVFTLLLFALCFSFSQAQIFEPEGVRMPGDWNSFSNSLNMGGPFDLNVVNVGVLRWQTSFEFTGTSGSQNFKFVTGGAGNEWVNQWGGVNFTANTLSSNIPFCSNCNPANNTINATNGKWYTVLFRDNGYSATEAIFMETSGEPVSINTVSLLDSTILPNSTPELRIKLAAAPPAEQLFFVRYTNNNFASSAAAQFTISGDSGSVNLPAFAANDNVIYYIFSTTIASPSGDFDILTINLNNNGGSNYNYTVSNYSPPTVDTVLVLNGTTLLVAFNEALDATSATTLANYSISAGVASAILNSGNDTLTLTLSNALNGTDTLHIENVENANNIAMAGLQSFEVSFIGIPIFQGFENTSNDNLPIIQGLANINSDIGAGQTPANQRIRTGSNSWSVNNQTRTLEFSKVMTDGNTGVYVNFYVSSTSGTTGNGAESTDRVRVFLNLNDSGYTAIPDLTIQGVTNSRWGFSEDGITLMARQPDTVATPGGTNNSPIYSNIKIQVPNGTSSVQLKLEVNNNATGEFWNIDDVFISSDNIDVTPPIITAINVSSNTTIGIKFNENLNQTSAENLANYAANNNITAAVLSAPDSVTLTLDPIALGIPDTLVISNIEDTSSNAMLSAFSYPFTYNNTSSGLVFSEIFYNPAGTDTLEFIEVYNGTGQSLNMGGITLQYLGSNGFSFTFPSYTVPNGEFLVMAMDTVQWNAIASISHLFPTPNYNNFGILNNTSGTLQLINSLGDTINAVTYQNNWDSRANGSGFSLELCDLNTDNSLSSNWSISTNQVKSNVFATPGTAPQCPQLITIAFASDSLTFCQFNEVGIKPNVGGGSGPFTFSWSPSSLVDDANADSVAAAANTSQWLFLTVNDGFSSSSDSVYLNVLPASDSTLVFNVCEGETTAIPGNATAAVGTYIDTLSATNGCDSIVTYIVQNYPTTNLFFASSPSIDGVFDGTAVWGEAYASNSNFGWAGARAKALYVTRDADYFYFAAEVDAANWQTWGFAINTKAGGGTAEPYGHQIDFNHTNKPDFVIRGPFPDATAYGNPQHVVWNGSSWDYFQLGAGNSSVNSSWVEVRILSSILENPEHVDVQFFISGNNSGEHGNFSSVPEDTPANDWNVSSNRNSLTSYAENTPNFLSQPTAYCDVDDTLMPFTPIISGGLWSGNSIVNTSNGAFNPSLINSGDTITYTITDSNSCVISAEIALSQLPNLDISASISNETCAGDSSGSISTTINNGESPFTYNWSNGDSSSSISNLSAGSFFLAVSDANGCAGIDTFNISTITILSNIGVQALENEVCIGDSTQIVTGLSDTGAYYYVLNNVDMSLVDALKYGDGDSLLFETGLLDSTQTFTAISGSYGNVNDNEGDALLLPGLASSYAAISHNALFNSSAVTLETWVYWTGSGTQFISGKGLESFELHTDGGGNVNNIRFIPTTQVYYDTPNNSFLPNTWNHVAAVYDPATSLGKIYINGVDANAVKSGSNPATTALNSNTNELTLGIRSGGSLPYNGKIDEFRFWNYALSAAEIAARYQKCLTGFESGLVAYYSFDGDTSSINDLSLNGIHGAIIGTGSISSGLGCSDACSIELSNNITIDVNPAPTVNITVSDISCNGLEDGQLTAVPNVGETPFNFTWSNTENTAAISNLSAGTYTVEFEDAKGCIGIDSAEIAMPDSISISAAITNVACFGENSGSIALNASGGTGGLTYSWSNTATSANISNLLANSYTVTVSDANSCSKTASFSVNQPSSALNASANTLNNALCGNPTGEVSASANGGTPPYSYAWSNSQSGATISNLGAGKYTVTISDSLNCTDTASAFVTEPTSLTVSISVNSGILCHNDSSGLLMATINGGIAPYTLLWSTGDSSNSIGNLTAGTYSLTVSDSSNCTASNNVNLSNPTALSLNLNIGTNILCFGDSSGAISATASGGTGSLTYSWSNGANTSSISNVMAGNYILTVSDSNNCSIVDSIMLTQPAQLFMASSESICSNENYTLPGGGTPVISGIYVDTLASVQGCDSIIETTLTINDAYTLALSEELCSGDSIQLAGGDFVSSTGVYTDSLQSVLGCDSIITTTVTVTPTYNIQNSMSICFGDTVMIGSQEASAAGTYIQNLQTTAGCDSIITTELTVNPINVAFTSTPPNLDGTFDGVSTWGNAIARNTNVGWAGAQAEALYVSSDKDYFYFGAEVNAADWQSWGFAVNTKAGGGTNDPFGHIISFQHNDKPDYIIRGGFTASSYGNELITWNGSAWQYNALGGQNFARSNDFVEVRILKSLLDNPSSVEVQFFITGNNTAEHATFSAVPNDEIAQTWQGPATTLSNYATQVNKVEVAEFTICIGDSIQLPSGNFALNTGIYEEVFASASSCDSVSITYLQALPLSFNQANASICTGDSIQLPKGTFTSAAGTYTDSFANANYCDSVVEFTVSIIPEITSNVSVSICSNESYILPLGATVTDAGTYYDTLTSASSGCDSVVITTIQVNPTSTGNDSVNVCAGDSILIGGIFRTQSGIYNDTLQNQFACDSVVSISVNVLDINEVNDTISICAGSSTEIFGMQQNSQGLYSQVFTAANSCDSVHSTYLEVIEPIVSNSSTSICDGDSVLIFGIWQSTAGVYTDTLVAANTCDSVIAVNLTVLQPDFTPIQFDLCTGDSVFVKGAFRSSSQIILDTLQNAASCDSVIEYTVSVESQIVVNNIASICQGDSIFIAGSFRNSAGVYNEVLPSTNSCDTLVNTTLVVNQVYDLIVNQTICDGESYLLPGGTNVFNTGTYTDSLQSSSGCDSVITTNIIVNPTSLDSITISICTNDSVFISGSYRFAGETVVDSLMNQFNCDSIVVTEIIGLPVYNVQQTESICEGDSIDIHGVFRNVAGIYVENYNSSLNCDSIVTVELMVYPAFAFEDTLYICQGDSVQLADGSFAFSSGLYQNDYQTTNGCDSTFKELVIVNNAYSTNDTLQICFGDSVQIGSEWIGSTGVYVQELQSISGCDSTVNTVVIVDAIYNAFAANAPILDGIFDGDSVWGNALANNNTVGWAGARAEGLYITSDADYYYFGAAATAASWQSWGFAINTVAGGGTADPFGHIISFDHDDKPDFVLRGGFTTSIYGNELVSWNGSNWNYSAFGANNFARSENFVEVRILKSLLGNPQTVEAQFFITGDNNAEHATFSAVPADDVAQSWQGPATTLSNYAGAVAEVMVTKDTICIGDSVQLANGTFASNSGIYINEFQSNSGCDSITVLQLNVLPDAFTQASITICQGDSVLLPDGTFTSNPGIYSVTLNGVNVCDSLISTEVFVNPNYFSSSNVAICFGENYMLADSSLVNADGAYTVTLNSVSGCDSVIEVNLSVLPEITNAVNTSICQNDSIFLQNAWQFVPGTYTDTYAASNGCDSVVTTTLDVIPLTSGSDTMSICAGDSALIFGNYESQAGVYVQNFATSELCDSMHSTTLIVVPSITTQIQVSICQGDSIFIAGAFQSNAGTYTEIFQGANSCDSIIETSLGFFSTSSTSIQLPICSGDSIEVLGNFYSADTSLTAVFTDVNSCDSLVEYVVIVAPTVNISQSMSICQGDSAMIFGNYQSQAGIYTDTLFSSTSCDTIIQIDLIVNSASSSAQQLSICEGDTAFFASGAYTSNAGLYVDSLQTQQGCDSIVSYQVQVLPASINRISANVCAGDSILLGGMWLSTGDSLVEVFQGSNSCDSIVITDIIELPNFLTQLNISACSGDSIFVAGAFQTTSGIYTETYSSVSGCDSIVEINLSFAPNVSIAISESICQGESYMLPSGNAVSNAGIYLDTISGGSNCDTIYNVTISITQPFVDTVQEFICQGDSILISGFWQNTSGIYTDSLTSGSGCDSTVITILDVLPVTFGQASVSICQGDSILINGTYQKTTGLYVEKYSGSNSCDSLVTINLTVLPSSFGQASATICQGDSILIGGSYRFVSGNYNENYAAANGCDSIVTYTLDVLPSSFNQASITICQGESILIDGSMQAIFAEGIYISNNTTSAGCDSIIEWNVSFFQGSSSAINIGNDTSICEGSSIQLTATGGTNYMWSTGDTSSSISFIVLADTLIWAETQSANGCLVRDSILITALALPTSNFGNLGSVCLNAAAINLAQGVTPPGGVFSGTGVVGNTFNPSASGIGNFNLTYTFSMGSCTASNVAPITVSGLPQVVFGGPSTVCENSLPLVLTGGIPAGGVYSGGNISGGNSFNPPSDGTYLVTYTFTNTAGCSGTANKEIVVVANPIVDLGPDQTIIQGNGVVLDAGNPGANYLWSNGITSQSIIVGISGTYSVVVTNSFGCAGSDEININVVQSIEEMAALNMKVSYYPNPSDGMVTMALEDNLNQNIRLQIFDLSGRLVDAKEFRDLPSNYLYPLDLSNYDSGVYLIQLITENGVKTDRIIIR